MEKGGGPWTQEIGGSKGGGSKGGGSKGGGPKGEAQRVRARRVGAPTQKKWEPEGWGPKVGAGKVGVRRVGVRRVGGPKFRAFFFPLPPPIFALLSPTRGVLVFGVLALLSRRPPESDKKSENGIWRGKKAKF